MSRHFDSSVKKEAKLTSLEQELKSLLDEVEYRLTDISDMRFSETSGNVYDEIEYLLSFVKFKSVNYGE